MAKKKAAAKKKPAAREKLRKGARAGVRKALAPRGRATQPRQPALPGTQQLRNRRLDVLCEELGDIREKKNKLSGEERSAISDSLAEMIRAGVKAYKHAGVVMARLPGAEKLTVKLTKDHGDASDATLEPGEAAGEGEDAGADAGGGDDLQMGD